MRFPQTGLTIPELLMALGIAALLGAMAVPAMDSFLIRQNLISQANRVLGMVHEARAEGAYRSSILVCSASTPCHSFRQPAPGLVLVADHNDNRQFDEADTMLQELLLPEGMTIQWRSFRMKPWLRINRFGVAYYQNGHFLLCYRGQARKVVLNYQARPRQQRDAADTTRCP